MLDPIHFFHPGGVAQPAGSCKFHGFGPVSLGPCRVFSSCEFEGSLRDENLSTQALEPMQLVHIPPRTLHRLMAKTDICLYEVSTADLDDVVRVADDFDRENGRIDGEHILNI